MSVDNVDDAKIERPTDAVVRITTTNICGSDLHMYEGRTDFEEGRILGHENVGEVVEVGDGGRQDQGRRHGLGAVQHLLRPLPQLRERPDQLLHQDATRRLGRCRLRVRRHGTLQGGQAEYLRVPYADFNLPAPARGRAGEAGRLRDALGHLPHRLPRNRDGRGGSWRLRRGLRLRAVGLMAAYSAIIRGAGKVMVVDRHPDRLRLAEEIGAIPIDDSKGSPVDAGIERDRRCGRGQGLRVRGLPGARPRWQRGPRHDHEQPRQLREVHRQDRLCGSVRTAGSRRARPDGPAGEGRLRFRHVLVQGPAAGRRPGPGQALQPPCSASSSTWARPSPR